MGQGCTVAILVFKIEHGVRVDRRQEEHGIGRIAWTHLHQESTTVLTIAHQASACDG